MLKLSLIFTCIIYFCAASFSSETNVPETKNIDIQQIIDVFEHGAYKEKMEAFKKLYTSWENGTLSGYDAVKMNELITFCADSVRNFPWDKYLYMSAEKLRNLPEHESETVNEVIGSMTVLAIGKITGNPEAEKFANYINRQSNKKLCTVWNKLLYDQKRNKDLREAHKMIDSGYAACKSKLFNIMKDKSYNSSQVDRFFLTGISNSPLFLDELKKDNQAAGLILSGIKTQFPGLKGNSSENKSVRMALVDLFYRLAPKTEAINWLEKVLTMSNLTEREKDIIRKNKLEILKLE